jgi:signal transduction histidine kinase
VISRFKYWWKYYSLLGVDQAAAYPIRRRQIMTNHANMIVIVISSLLLIVDTLDKLSRGALVYSEDLNHEYGFGYRFVLAIIVAIINLNIVETKYKSLSRYLLVFVVPYIYLFLPLQVGHIYDELYLWYPYAGIPFIVLPPMILGEKQDRVANILALLLLFSLALFSNELLNLFSDRQLVMQEIVKIHTVFYRVVPTSVSLFVLAGVNYLIILNDRNALKLDDKNRVLGKTIFELKKTQGQLIKNEKMAVVGRMSSELTHEINTPISAIKANLSLIAYDQKHRLKLLRRIGSKCSEKELDQLNRLVRQMYVLNRDVDIDVSGLNERASNEALAQKINNMGLSNGQTEKWLMCLSEVGILDPTPYKELIKAKATDEITDFIIGEYQQGHSFRISNQAIAQAEKLIEKLKSYAYSKDLAEIKPFSLSAVVYTSLDLLQSKMKNIKCEVDVQPSLPTVLGQADEIMQVVNNLLVNAIQAMDHEGDLSIRLSGDDDELLLAIEDSGGGIEVSEDENVFEAFFTTKKKGEGTGLGLYICKEIVEKHQGHITWSNTSRGARFVVSLPTYLQAAI